MLGETEAPPPGDDGTASALGAEEKGTHRALPYPATLVFSSGYGSLRPSRHQCTPSRASESPAHVKLYIIHGRGRGGCDALFPLSIRKSTALVRLAHVNASVCFRCRQRSCDTIDGTGDQRWPSSVLTSPEPVGSHYCHIGRRTFVSPVLVPRWRLDCSTTSSSF